MRVIIIGNGIAGVMTANNLRIIEPDNNKLSIDIFTREPYSYYARVRLPEIFGLNKVIDDLQIFKEDWYEKRQINVHYNMNVIDIDRKEKKIIFEDKSKESYEKLVLACGASSFMPDIPNNKLSGIFRIREYNDALALQNHIKKGAKSAIVLGGGLLGLETARFMSEIKDITVIEMYPRLLPRQLDEEGAEILKSIIQSFDIKVLLGVKTDEFIGIDKLEGLKLKDSRIIKADTAVVSVGIVPNIELAKNSGLLTNRGIVANEYLQSSGPDIYLAGDNVEFESIVMGIIPAALEHAQIVASNLLKEDKIKFKQIIPKTSLKIAGINLTSVGKVILTTEEEKEYEICSKKDNQNNVYMKFVLKDKMLIGSIILGDKNITKWAEQNTGKIVNKDELPL